MQRNISKIHQRFDLQIKKNNWSKMRFIRISSIRLTFKYLDNKMSSLASFSLYSNIKEIAWRSSYLICSERFPRCIFFTPVKIINDALISATFLTRSKFFGINALNPNRIRLSKFKGWPAILRDKTNFRQRDFFRRKNRVNKRTRGFIEKRL